ncbi:MULTISPECIES: aspartate aminotransferase family protein [unclassified Fibrobacter]|uniref:aspartate aminotransferase family protein n=1 Tax=unclassified Fibrobacter TaxID=2634177 RepID=UPI000D6B801B|nr:MULTISPECIES: acetylornithine/succinylornithine family transaminase [unclassified Fibrobacter]PWJ60740.1 acetylornithine/N-succinyldiaminopimelate aminotransferase [Fibrobacter sp. UWR4]PZW64356.1 acetylornithine/N-succinyldiaminopimelate aminotransferase [Fibrobacter sp. UWR1]
MNFLEQDKQVIAPLYGKADIEIVKGEGSYLIDTKGDKYLDFVAGIAVNALGHQNKAIKEAVMKQMDSFNHISNLYVNMPQVELGKKLLEITGFGKAFFCNSGTEANEGCIKFARKYFDRKGEPNRLKIITFVNSFHGRTFAALSATGQPALRQGFGHMPGDFVHVAWNDCAALKAEVNKDTCAIMLESLAAEGGVMTLSAEMVETINSLQKEFGVLVIVDEVQAGCGRLGTFLGFEKYGLNPDLVSLAKGIGGGLPLGAVLLRQKIADELKAGDHGTTFGGNPIACAAGLAVVNQIDAALMKNVVERGAQIRTALADIKAKYSFIKEIRGEGLIVGLALDESMPVGNVVAAARAEKLMVLSAKGNVLRMLPPLNVSEAECSEAMAKLAAAFAKVVG